jgi:type 2 lantibiotic biosynthesis protein LanM
LIDENFEYSGYSSARRFTDLLSATPLLQQSVCDRREWNVSDLLVAPAEPATAGNSVKWSPSWWAAALTLAERCAPPRRPVAPASSEPAAQAERQLTRWRETFWLTGPEWVAGLLGQAELDEAGLLALLAEAPTDLADRAGQPGWAYTVESVLARMPAEPGMPDPPADDQVAGWAGLAAIVAPFANLAVDRLGAVMSAERLGALADLDRLRGSLMVGLERTLVLLAARTLILELHVLRESGQLTGDTPRQRFWSFVRHFSRPAGLAGLFAEYPVLARLLVEAADRASTSWMRLLHRLAADRGLVVDAMLDGNDPGPLVEVRIAEADWRDPRRSVALLRFADDTWLAYRPHPSGVYTHFSELVRWLNRRLPGLDLRTAHVIDRRGYGWVEFVKVGPCRDRAELLYYRVGALLALLYASGGTGILGRDVIACGDQPVPVDLAGLCQPTLPAPWVATDANDPAVAALKAAVYPVDLRSAPAGSGSWRTDFPGTAWEAPATDRMRLVRSALDSTDQHAQPADVEDALLAGFEAAYDAVAAGQAELVGPHGLLWRFANVKVRVRVRAVEVYQQLLAESTHPDVLRDALDRDRLLGGLVSTPTDDSVRVRIAMGELAGLRAGVIPDFASWPGSGDLVAPDGAVIWDAVADTCLDRLTTSLSAENNADRVAQAWIIRARLAARAAPATATTVPAAGGMDGRSVDPERCLTMGRRLADHLIEVAQWRDDRPTWLGMTTLDERHWSVWPLGVGLCGYPGVALFLAKLAELTGEDRYAAVAGRALDNAVTFVDRIDGWIGAGEPLRSGPFHGVTGLGYALVQVAASLDDVTLLGPTLSSIAATAMASIGSEPSVAAGAAGCVAAMLAIDAAIDSPVARRVADVGAGRLVEWVTQPVPGHTAARSAGFARGWSGAGWALLWHADATGEQRSAEAGAAAFERVRKAGSPVELGWCEGVTGIGLARTGSPQTGAADVATDLEAAVRAIVSAGPVDNHSLCHGELGCLELLTVAVQRGQTELAAVWRRRVARLLDELERDGPRCGTPRNVPTPDLLTGLSGIGYGLLRLGFPDRVPSVLLLEPPRSRPRRGRSLR